MFRSLPVRLSLLVLSAVLTAGCGAGSGAGSPTDGPAAPGGEAPNPSTESATESAAALRSLPYADWVPVEKGESREGVTRWSHEHTAPGVTLFSPRHEARAVLVDLAGRTRHVWAAELPGGGPWQHVELLPGGDLVLLVKDRLLARIDWGSNVVWAVPGRFHHEVVRVDDSRLWALDRHERPVSYPGGRVPTLTDRVLEIDAATGQVLRRVDLLPALRGFVEARFPDIAAWFERQRERDAQNPVNPDAPLNSHEGGRDAEGRLIADTPPDLFHTNSVRVLERDLPGLGSAGRLLLSVRHLNRLVGIDPGTGDLVWSWGEEVGLDGQHHATVVGDGRILLFDNGRERGWSRVLEMDAATGEVVWTYQAEPRESFWSYSRGSAQRLANGNTLVTESDFGRIFEVTREGEVVWEFLGPIYRVAGPDGEPVRAAIYRAARIEGELLDSLREPLRRSRRQSSSASSP